jgi:hypothetical protein
MMEAVGLAGISTRHHGVTLYKTALSSTALRTFHLVLVEKFIGFCRRNVSVLQITRLGTSLKAQCQIVTRIV